ncbi:hypothetical protein [Microbacterium candidum]|uniref:Uncharacterized protein n=1 Tax=Microbacterium candidum TaxID=3041922 RepID=A0ABT7MVW8_9MICO|nr:hypothetical protein [Microbacterium sp. ASV49]MDL9978596.1 hypothetical protein [Microbacterium sp. ASV49]
MSHLSPETLAQLKDVAFEVREVFGERGYRISSAIRQDRAFHTSSRPRSELTRSLVSDAVRAGAARVGMDFELARGGAVQIRVDAGSRYQIVRVKRATRLMTGEPVIVANSASSWGAINEELLWPEEPWVFGYVAEGDWIEELFVAEVLGVTPGAPGRLILGAETVLGEGNGPSSGGGFRGDHGEELPGFEDDDESDGEADAGNW